MAPCRLPAGAVLVIENRIVLWIQSAGGARDRGAHAGAGPQGLWRRRWRRHAWPWAGPGLGWAAWQARRGDDGMLAALGDLLRLIGWPTLTTFGWPGARALWPAAGGWPLPSRWHR
jgi:hypothetical protein